MRSASANERRPLTTPGLSKTAESLKPSWRGSLFRKYVVTLVSLVALVLAINAAVETWFLYRETIGKVTRAQAQYAAATRLAVEDALSEIERQVGWVTRASAQTLAQHRNDYEALLEQTPDVLAVAFVDGEGRERVRVRRVGGPDPATLMELQTDLVRGFGAFEFLGTDVYSNLAIPHSGADAGTTIVQVKLPTLARAVPSSTAGEASYAYVVNARGRVVARSEASPLVVGDQAAAAPEPGASGPEVQSGVYGRDMQGRPVVRSRVAIAPIPASVIVEQPLQDALAPLRELLIRLGWLLAFGLLVAICASLFLARRMLVPIRALHLGAERFAANQFDHRIEVRTGDEFEQLATRFNHMADALSASYAGLESEIRRQTHDLAQSVSELKNLEESGREIASSLRMEDVLAAVMVRAVALSGAEAGGVYLNEDAGSAFVLAAERRMPAPVVLAGGSLPLDALVSIGAEQGEAVLIPALSKASWFPARAAVAANGFETALVIALTDVDSPLGLVLLLSREPAGFPASSPNVLHSFAHQAALAIRNARLFHEIDEKGRQLAAADLHKTQFFANMSHELRTPLNAVLGYSELLVDGLYGPLTEKALDALERIQINGRHLLSLINDVLDFTKIEAGLLNLNVQDYSLAAIVETAVSSTSSLAMAKNLAVEANIAPNLPLGQGDERRLTQVLLNLIGNAIKFTESGSIRVGAEAEGDWFTVTVADTGPGIAPADQARIFDEFHQIDSSSTRRQGGTGLGLSIARKLVLLHGGRIEVESEIGCGAVFRVVLPVRPRIERQAA